MKMAYEYIRVIKTFSISKFPSTWCYPVSLLMQVRETDLSEPFVLQPRYCISHKQPMVGDRVDMDCFEELIPDKEY